MYNIIFINKNNKQKHTLTNISCAKTFTQRLIGLMGKNQFKGLIFKQNNNGRINSSIHTCFMKEKIDLIYINHEMKIQEMITLNPWKLYIPKKGYIKYIIELPEKSITKYELKTNTKVVITNEKRNYKQTKESYTNSNEHY